jgi:hypothetical protein
MKVNLTRRLPAVTRPAPTGSALTRSVMGALIVVLLGTAAPALAQSAGGPDAEARLRRLEAEVRALQRQVFPGSDGKFFTPEITPGAAPVAPPPGSPASTPVTDLLTRMEAVEAQLARLTAQNEETANRVAQLEAKFAAIALPAALPADGAGTPAPAPVPAAVIAPPAPAPALAPAPRPAAAVAKPAVATPKPVAAKPTAARVAAVQKIEKPRTGDAGDDEYSYGYRLWDAKFFPEAAQLLRLFVDKYPRHAKISYGRNLLGRALLDDGNPREAGAWFVKNYQADKAGARASDSLLSLAEAMRQLKDTNRACIALAEFGEVYPRDAAGRLKGQFDGLRSGVKCD